MDSNEASADGGGVPVRAPDVSRSSVNLANSCMRIPTIVSRVPSYSCVLVNESYQLPSSKSILCHENPVRGGTPRSSPSPEPDMRIASDTCNIRYPSGVSKFTGAVRTRVCSSEDSSSGSLPNLRNLMRTAE